MKKHLFYTFLLIFVATATITLLGILRIVHIDDFYLRGLFSAFLVELGGAVIGLFKKVDFFTNSDAPEKESDNTNIAKSLQTFIGSLVVCMFFLGPLGFFAQYIFVIAAVLASIGLLFDG
jgi:hypothetical protein